MYSGVNLVLKVFSALQSTVVAFYSTPASSLLEIGYNCYNLGFKT